jgi:CheY-like chemotaxis protein
LGKRVLVIDDDQVILEAVETILEDMGHEVECYAEAEAGERQALQGDYDLILLDIRMPAKNGAEITERVLRERPQAQILVVTGYPTDPLARRALEAGAKALIRKPFEIGKVLDFLKG